MDQGIKGQVTEILRDGVSLVDEIVLHLQTGREDRGIADFMLLIESLSAVIAVLQDNKENIVQDFDALGILDFNRVMQEIAEAWEHMDVVLVADLLEYELKARLQTLAEQLG